VKPLTLVEVPALVQGTPLLTFVAADDAGTLKVRETSITAVDAASTLRNMKYLHR
jgi:hypothetical protein